MTDQEAKAKIQERLAEMTRILHEEVLPLAREHKVEFEFLDMSYHLFPRRNSDVEIYSRSKRTFRYIPRPPAPEGLLVSDDEWESSTFGCSARYWDWHSKSWPELEED